MTVHTLPVENGLKYTEKNFDTISNSTGSTTSEMETNPEGTKTETRPPIWKKFAGIVLTIMASFFFTLGSVIVKSISEVSVSELTTYRYAGGLLLAFILVVECKQNWFGPSSWAWRFWMLVRAISGTTNIFLFYLALKFIPLADATIFMLSVPVFVFIFARIFLKEPFGRWHLLAMVISTLGIVLASKVIDFNSLFGGAGGANATLGANYTTASNETLDDSTDESDSPSHLVGILLCIACIFTMSLVYISLRKVRKCEHSVILFNFCLIGLLEMLVINSIWFQFRLPVQEYNAYWVMALAVFSFFGQIFLTKASQLEEAGVVSIVRCSSDAVFAFVFQVAFFGEPLELLSVLGAILVLASIFFLSFRKYIIALPDDSALRKKLRFLE